MMRAVFKRRFKKEYRRLSEKVQKQFTERLEMLREDICHPKLRVHSLVGNKKGFMSMNVTGDYCAWFTKEGCLVTFYSIGTHSKLYRK